MLGWRRLRGWRSSWRSSSLNHTAQVSPMCFKKPLDFSKTTSENLGGFGEPKKNRNPPAGASGLAPTSSANPPRAPRLSPTTLRRLRSRSTTSGRSWQRLLKTLKEQGKSPKSFKSFKELVMKVIYCKKKIQDLPPL